MATISQDPAGQASVTLSGIGFNNITATASPFWESIKTATGASVTLSGISFNNITATATPVYTGSRITVEGGSFAVNFGGPTSIVTEALIAGMVSVINPLGTTEITTSANLPPSVVNLDEENLVAVADDNSPSLTIFGATLP